MRARRSSNPDLLIRSQTLYQLSYGRALFMAESRDSNPGYSFRLYNRLAGDRLHLLGHLSAFS